jgi:hypothetical protein
MDADLVDALAEAAADGVDFDGLAIRRAGDGYALATGDEAETTLQEGDLADALAARAAYATNWRFWHAEVPQAEPRWAFLRWLERARELAVPERYDELADGETREWGQLAITVTIGSENGSRHYDLRHVADSDADRDDLETYRDPLEARDLVKYDDRGRYRPLKTAPTLPTGWVFPDLDAAEAVRTVGFVYPATVENWHREREGDLDVSHWRETMERQTGIYGVVKTWDRGEGHDHVNWVAEACCADSQCLKRRAWEYDGDADLDVAAGEGEFPCREPCSLVIAGARKWTKLEGEETRTYEFELTPGEKEQVEAIIGAVAEGRTDEIREADFGDPANRWRARYLRAKRFEGGDLGGVPTDPGSHPGDGAADELDDADDEPGDGGDS